MSDYRIFTDVTADLPDELLKEIGVEALPMPFRIGEEEHTHYADFREMPMEDFYRRVKGGEKASTSQVTYSSFMDAFTPVLEAGMDVLYLSFSSALSGTYQGSLVAVRDLIEKFPDRKIMSVDTRCASSGEGMLVYYAAKQKQEGMSMDQLVLWVEQNKLKVCHWFTVDDLHFLRSGGRISAMAATVGSMLKVKPVMHVDDAGRLVPVEKVRGRKKAIQTLIRRMAETGVDLPRQTVFLCQAVSREEAEEMAKQIKFELRVKDVIVTDIGPIIGAHAGPGTISLFFFGSGR